jgi:hypothetical protein
MAASFATIVLTAVHHAYGAVAYSTPWRMHVVVVGALVAALTAAAFSLHGRARGGGRAESAAFWTFVGLNLLFPVLGIGAFEGFYNHAVKNLVYYASASRALFDAMFPPPTYELPTDLFFEFTGILQVAPAAVTALYLARAITHRGKA